MSNIVNFPTFTEYGPRRTEERRRLAHMFAGKSIEDMRHMWDNISNYESFYHAPDGQAYDCADIHLYMNMLGDGRYCAV